MTKASSLKMKATFLIVFGCFAITTAVRAQVVPSTSQDNNEVVIEEAEGDSINQVENFMIDLDDSAFDLESSNLDLKYPDFADSIYHRRLRAMNSPIPVAYNDQVANYIRMYCFRKRQQMERMLGVSQVYFPIFEEVLRSNGMPTELKYMAVIESALNPEAVSRAGAVGMWQFMRGTAKMYGLKMNRDVDERRDIYKASMAAATYLKNSYDRYGDWLLAIASYNCGPGNVDKAIARSGGKRNYWEILKFLPKETRGYVPAFIGAMYVMNYYHLHNLSPQYPDNKFCTISCVPVTEKMSIDKIALFANCSVDDLKFLNPGLNTNVLPIWDGEPYQLKIPSAMLPVYDTMKDSIVFSSREVVPQYRSKYAYAVGSGSADVHTVRRGETIGAIATRYHVSVALIKKWNGLRGNMIRPGQRLKLYGGTRTMYAARTQQGKNASGKAATNGDKIVYYKVKRGDTLWSIAKKYKGVTVADIKAANSPSKTSSLKTGTTLKIIL